MRAGEAPSEDTYKGGAQQRLAQAQEEQDLVTGQCPLYHTHKETLMLPQKCPEQESGKLSLRILTREAPRQCGQSPKISNGMAQSGCRSRHSRAASVREGTTRQWQSARLGSRSKVTGYYFIPILMSHRNHQCDRHSSLLTMIISSHYEDPSAGHFGTDPTEPGEELAMDSITGLSPSRKGLCTFDAILVVVD